MAFDIYAGGFARYFARGWENVAQKSARETGMEYRMIRPAGDPGPAKWEEVQEGVQHWKTALRQGLGEHAPADLDWDESRQAPYFTDRPGWEGYSALVVMAACTACREPLPEQLAKEALASEIVARVNAPNFQGPYRTITQVQLWLPGSFNFTFQCADLCNEKTVIGSVSDLVRDIDGLIQAQAITEEEIATAMRNAFDAQSPFRLIACVGVGVFRHVAQDALRYRLPLMLSF